MISGVYPEEKQQSRNFRLIHNADLTLLVNRDQPRGPSGMNSQILGTVSKTRSALIGSLTKYNKCVASYTERNVNERICC